VLCAALSADTGNIGTIDIIASLAYNSRMDLLVQAYKAVQDAEHRIRSLLEQAVSSGEYDAVVPLVGVAKRLALECRGVAVALDGDSTISAPSVPSSLAQCAATAATEGEPEVSTSSRARAKKKAPAGYPKFICQGDELVKIGWSKTSKSEYEHRAPRVVAMRLAEVLEEFRANGRMLTMDQVLPLKREPHGNEVPDYQVYLCLAWLRALALVEKHGRSGYSVISRENLPQAVENAWQRYSAKQQK